MGRHVFSEIIRPTKKVLDTLLSHSDLVLEAQSVKLMFQIIDRMTESVRGIEKQLAELTKDDEMVNRLMTIRGCGKITAWTIRAYTEDIGRFASAKNMRRSADLFHGYRIQMKPFITGR